MYKVFYEFTNSDDGNLAYHVKDIKENVDNNRLKLSKKHGFELENLFYMNQVHGDNVVIVDKNSPRFIDNCDALITNDMNLTLMVMVADCIPIILIDRKKGVIAAIHAGRNSTFLKIVSKTVEMMIDSFCVNPNDIEAIMGPSARKCCYEVSPELADIVNVSFGKEFTNGRFIDLQGINKKLLEEQGVSNIRISNICTICSKDKYYSFRVNKECGRFAGIVTLSP